MMRVDPPDYDHLDLHDFSVSLDPGIRLIQALRRFAGRSSILLAAYHYLEFSYQVLESKKAGTPYKDQVRAFFLNHCIRNQALISMRALCESSDRSLGAGSIYNLLGSKDNAFYLKNYLVEEAHWNENKVGSFFDDSIIYIRKICGLLGVPDKNINKESHALSRKVALIRRMVNKHIAHVTLDSYKVSFDEIHDVFLAIMGTAMAIRNVMGERAIPSEYEEIEDAAILGAIDIFGMHEHEKYIPMLKEYVPAWIRGKTLVIPIIKR